MSLTWHFRSVFNTPLWKVPTKGESRTNFFSFAGLSFWRKHLGSAVAQEPIGHIDPKRGSKKLPLGGNLATWQSWQSVTGSITSLLDISALLPGNLRTNCSIVTLCPNGLVLITNLCWNSEYSVSHWHHGAGWGGGPKEEQAHLQGVRGCHGRQGQACLQGEEDKWRGSKAGGCLHR